MHGVVWWFIASVHVLASAAWLGAMIYSLTILHPRAKKFFGTDDEQFELFISTVSSGARWKVVSGLGLIALTGALLIPLAGSRSEDWHWRFLIAAKSILWLTAMAIFWRVSWRLWPARIFATPEERPALRGKFRRAGLLLISIAAISMALGLLAHGR